ncbi:hypothetical protein ElyMa_006899700 [Elysia marginata]|uniref:Uncharacterized protein n=1 Tax=Elysia marginata TaxID=1093978 RepID=A0AAV4JG76_9GAST|nr:hypothetical protein ElyMa_006899700 [Elysia marginata]
MPSFISIKCDRAHHKITAVNPHHDLLFAFRSSFWPPYVQIQAVFAHICDRDRLSQSIQTSGVELPAELQVLTEKELTRGVGRTAHRVRNNEWMSVRVGYKFKVTHPMRYCKTM